MTTDPDTLREYRSACSGQPYRSLVELYAVRHDPGSLEAQIRSTLDRFTPGAVRGAERLYNVWNRRGQRDDVLALDCRDAMDRVIADARRRLPDAADGQALVRAFRLVTLGLALTASAIPDARRQMGIRTAGEMHAGSPENEG